MYILDKIMPFTADSLKIGYTDNQLKGCFANEGRIWNFFVTNNLLLSNEPALQKNYMGDGPSTPELGEGSPGYIGLFTGRQIVGVLSAHDVVKAVGQWGSLLGRTATRRDEAPPVSASP